MTPPLDVKRGWQRSKLAMGELIDNATACDALIYVYFFVVSAVLMMCAAHPQELELVNFTTLLTLTAIIWLDTHHRRPWISFIHAWVPLVFVIAEYFEIAPMVQALHPNGAMFDAKLHAIDLYLIGDPTVLVTRYASRGWAEVLTICYASYFFLPVILAVSVFHRKRDFNQVVTTLAMTFAITFVSYLAIPALGPNRAVELARPEVFDGYYFAGRLHRLLSGMEGQTPDAFPSGHTLLTLLVLALTKRYRPRMFWVFLPFGTGLIAATLYLRYHYLADFILSVLLAPLCLWAGERLVKEWDQRELHGVEAHHVSHLG